MGLFGRRKETLNERLLREGGMDVAGQLTPTRSQERKESEAYDPLGEQEAPFETPFMPAPPESLTRPLDRRRAWEGFQREREFDALVTVAAPAVPGEEVEFVALPGGDLLVVAAEGEESLAPLADAVERSVAPPYRARAVRTSGDLWSVAANRIEVVEMSADGDNVDVAMHGGERSATVDGLPTSRRFPELERLGGRTGTDYAIHAERLDGDLWQAWVAAL